MSSNVAVRGNTAMSVPAELAAMFGNVQSNIQAGEQVPHLSLKGKVWKVVMEGNEKVITTKVDGEDMPAPTVKVIIVNQVAKRSRAFFEGAYVEGTNKAPDCWSVDGEKPDSSITEPQHSRCDGCPQAIKGSKITEQGEATMACSSNKRIVVVPSNKPDFTALLLKLPVTSLWEGEPKQETQGWFAYDAYLKYLKSNGVPHTAMVETIMKFDADVAYPKVLFKFAGYINGAVAAVVAPRVDSDEVMERLGLKKVEGATKAVEHKPEEKPDDTEAEMAAVARAAEVARKAEAAKEADKAAKKAAKEAAKKAEAEELAKKAAASKASDDDGFGDSAKPTTTTTTTKAATAVAVAEGDGDLSKILSGWD